jgi:hypothetical protein
MSQTQWKKFPFFESAVIVGDSQGPKRGALSASPRAQPSDEISPEDIHTLSDIPKIAFVVLLKGFFYVSDPAGRVFVCSNNDVVRFFEAHSAGLSFLQKSSSQEFLVSVGLDMEDQVKRGYIKLWNVDESEGAERGSTYYAQLPEMVSSKMSAFAMTDDTSRVAIGLSTGSIYYILKDSKANTKKTLTPGERRDPITNLYFLPKEKALYLFFTTDTSVGVFELTEKREGVNILEEEDGSVANCADLDIIHGRLVVGMTALNAVTLFHTDFKGATWMLEDQKMMLRCFRSHILTVSLNKAQKTHQLVIYDVDNKLISYVSNHTSVEHILCEADAIYVFAYNQRRELTLQKLTEKDSAEKMAVLFKKNMFEIAYSMARLEGYDEGFIAEISRMQGDHYYEKEDFDNAINCYKQTVGYVEPSYIIIQFLDASKIEYLTSYLETLHSKHQANTEHTALLLNCYVHLKATTQLNNFLAQSDKDYGLFDAETAINVCVEAKCYDKALSLADKHAMFSLYVKILVEEMHEYDAALRYIREKMSLSGKARVLKEYRQHFMRHSPEVTRVTIFEIARGLTLNIDISLQLPEEPGKEEKRRINSEDTDLSLPNKEESVTLTLKQVLESLISVLSENLVVLEEFLGLLISRYQGISDFIYHKLFEVYLQQRKQTQLGTTGIGKTVAPPRSARDLDVYGSKIKQLLDDARNRYDKSKVLMLLQVYEYSEGIVYLCQLMDNKQELMFYFMKQSDYENIINLCKSHGREDSDLWVQALTYFANKQDEDGKNIKRISQILEELDKMDFLSPLVVLEILSKNSKITFGVLQDFLKRQFRKNLESMAQDKSEYERTMTRVKTLRKEMLELKTQARRFQSTKCSGCDQKLTLPSVHFMCLHSYHQHCLTDSVRHCMLCVNESKVAFDRKRELEEQRLDHQLFFSELEGAQDRFKTIAKYFSRGLFGAA